MDHNEIRAVRGSLSRAAFARLLGVTSLTVLRWELADGSKEARRPRPRMIEALRKLAADRVGYAENADHDAKDVEDDDASEPPQVGSKDAERPLADAPLDAQQKDEALVLPLLDRLSGTDWPQAESDLLALVASSTLQTHAGRTLAALGLVQAHFFGRFDVRGVMATILPILDDATQGRLPPAIAARAHVLGAFVFGAPDSRFFDIGRVNVHAERADQLLDSGADELRCMLAAARIAASRFLGPHVALRAYSANAANLQRASSPLTRFMAERLHGLAAVLQGQEELGAHHSALGFELAERLGLWGMVLAVLADRTCRMLRGAHLPEAVLALTRQAREARESGHLPPSESFLRILASEIEVYLRLGRFEDANRVTKEALELARSGGIVRFPLASPLNRLLVYTNRYTELRELAESFETESALTQPAQENVTATFLRATLAAVAGENERASELMERVCTAPETTVGIDYVLRDAHYLVALGYVIRRDHERARAAFERSERFYEQRPSVWHSALLRRIQGFARLTEGRFAEARQKLESTVATFALIGDTVESALARVSLALVARAAGAADAEQRFEAAADELEALGIVTPLVKRQANEIARPAVNAWVEQSMTERLVIAVERLSVQGLTGELFVRELRAVLGQLFSGRNVVIGQGTSPEEDSVVLADRSGNKLFVRVEGALDSEQHAALRLLAVVAPWGARTSDGDLTPDPEVAADAVLPEFIAVAAATRQLKSEIARLARSTATILVTRESGSGKEVVSRAVHDLSLRAGKPYVVFNCASIPRDLFESQLFGHRRGSFTGATSDNPGVIRAADTGTLFLDEIGELPLDTQPKLLRFLENADVLPIGEQKARRVDVRVLAATHRDLGRLVREGRFREDLYYRLNVVPLHVPPLRERPDDILALARVFLRRLTPEDANAPELASDAVTALRTHTWPGNVRELRNVIERTMAYAPIPRVLYAEDLRITTA